MTMNTRRRDYYRRGRNPFLSPPGWATFHDIGWVYHRRLPKHASFHEIGRQLGVSKQNAYHECMVALGKLIYLLAVHVGETPETGKMPVLR
jgi:hypothetical protein